LTAGQIINAAKLKVSYFLALLGFYPAGVSNVEGQPSRNDNSKQKQHIKAQHKRPQPAISFRRDTY